MEKASGIMLNHPGILGFLSQALVMAGENDRALNTLDEAFAIIKQTDERHWESELYRLKANLILAQGNPVLAEADFQKAIEIARQQSAKSWELRTAIDLGRLWQKMGKKAEAHHLLSEIYGWFSEGFDTPDLIAAKRLIDELSKSSSCFK